MGDQGRFKTRGRRGNGMGRRRTPCQPTDAWPGTEEKIRVLMARAAAGQELFHEHDPHLYRDRGISSFLTLASGYD